MPQCAVVVDGHHMQILSQCRAPYFFEIQRPWNLAEEALPGPIRFPNGMVERVIGPIKGQQVQPPTIGHCAARGGQLQTPVAHLSVDIAKTARPRPIQIAADGMPQNTIATRIRRHDLQIAYSSTSHIVEAQTAVAFLRIDNAIGGCPRPIREVNGMVEDLIGTKSNHMHFRTGL